MKEIEIEAVSALRTEFQIEEVTRHELQSQIKEESQVIVHCLYKGSLYDTHIRIWKSTYLYVKNSNHRSELVHAENISMHPDWTLVPRGQTINFTLIFTGFPKHCKKFDLIENIPEPGGFVYINIKRNNTDVYHIKLR